jgi:catechol 2,3-dioxygenase-like lactoylglutathione lyase family enzyme
MIDHVYISVTNIENSLAFYSETLKPLGWHECGNYNSASGPEGVPDLFGLCDDIYGTGNGSGRASGCGSANRVRQASTSASSAGVTRLSMPHTQLRSKQAVSTRASQPTVPTSPLAITPPTLPTSTAIGWSSSTRHGILSDPHEPGNGLAFRTGHAKVTGCGLPPPTPVTTDP